VRTGGLFDRPSADTAVGIVEGVQELADGDRAGSYQGAQSGASDAGVRVVEKRARFSDVASVSGKSGTASAREVVG